MSKLNIISILYNATQITLFFGVQVAPYTKRKHVKFMMSKERLIL